MLRVHGEWFDLEWWARFKNLPSQTVDNRGQDDGDGGGAGGNQLQRQNSKGEVKEGDGAALQATPIEKLIHTKWAESKITFHQAIDPAKMNL